MLFEKPVKILALTRKHLLLVKVYARSRIIKDPVVYEWKQGTLESVLAKALSDMKTKRVRILLGNDISYTLRLSLPVSIVGLEERELINEKIKEEIPESFEATDWDFADVRKLASDQKEIFVFVPVKRIFEELKSAVNEMGLEVTAIEPQNYAMLRNENPLIGLALKKDIKGEDSEVLNLLVNNKSSY